ncbi:hypothetical protein [Alkalinema pantanalense]|uniref:hypothetical protein n=1 Tax=Alkalinema pantanalense TaxID=1620705 RepID=UPI003D6F61A1
MPSLPRVLSALSAEPEPVSEAASKDLEIASEPGTLSDNPVSVAPIETTGITGLGCVPREAGSDGVLTAVLEGSVVPELTRNCPTFASCAHRWNGSTLSMG